MALVDKLAHEVAVADRRARGDGVVGVVGRPDAEARLVLGGQRHDGRAQRLGGRHPLRDVERLRVGREGARILVAGLRAGEGRDREVHEHLEAPADVVALPRRGERRRRARLDWLRRGSRGGSAELRRRRHGRHRGERHRPPHASPPLLPAAAAASCWRPALPVTSQCYWAQFQALCHYLRTAPASEPGQRAGIVRALRSIPIAPV